MMQATNYVLNMTSVTISSYTTGNSAPANAIIFATDEKISIFSPTSVMNLIVDNTLRLQKMINAGSFTANEKLMLSLTNINIHLDRSSLIMSYISVNRNLTADVAKSTQFIAPIYLQEKYVKFSNMNVQITGYIMYSLDPMSLYVENSYFQYDYTMGGFVMESSCNYPEAYINGNVVLNNLTVVDSDTRYAPFMQAILMHAGSENVTVNNTIMKIWTSLANDKGQIEKHLTTDCNPQDNAVQIVQVINSYWTHDYNPNGDRFTCFYNELYSSYSRKFILNYSGNTHENIYNNVYSLNLAYTTYNTEIWMRNNIFRNVSCLQGGAFIVKASTVISENEVYEDSSNFGFNAYAFMNMDSISIRNFTFRNLNGTRSSTEYYIYLILNEGGSALIDGLKFTNSYVGFQTGVYIQDNINSLLIQNCIFQNLIVGSNNYLINTGSFKKLQIVNTLFQNITSQTSDDYGNIMILINSIDLTSASNSLVDNITVSDSKLGFIYFNTISGKTASAINFTISNINYKDCIIQSELDLISFGNIETQEDISFTMNNIQFNNVTFQKYGNLLSFKQQINKVLLLENSYFQNVVSAFIYIEVADKQNLNVTTKIRIYNTTFTNIDAQYGSLIEVNEGGYLEIDQSVFNTISCFEEGPILYAGLQKATVIITNSTFYNNTSIQGGVFKVDSESVIKIYNSEIKYNFGVVSGVIHSDNNGYYEIYGSKIHHNYAVSSSVSQIYDVVTSPIIDSSVINDNYVFNTTSLISELIGPCANLCFLKTAFKSYLLANPSVYEITSSGKFFQLIQSNIIIRNSSKFYNGDGVIDSFISNFNVADSQFYNMTIKDYCFKVTTSNATVTNSTFDNLSVSDSSTLFQISFDGMANFNSVWLTNSHISFSTVLSATMKAYGITINNVKSQNEIINISGATGIIIQDSIFSNINSNNIYLIYLAHTLVNNIKNVTVSNSNNSPLYLHTSNVTIIDSFSANNCTITILIESSNIQSVINSNFMNIGGTNSFKGGALYILNSNLTIDNTSFVNNTAVDGGAIYYSCPGVNQCVLSIQNSTFMSNKGVKSGGAIKYDVFRPKLSNISFKNNSALYGTNIASYPIKIKITNSSDDQITFSNIGSNIQENITFGCALYDYDDQINTLDSTSNIYFKIITNNTQAIGTSTTNLVSGVGSFNNIIFVGEPGSTNVRFGLDSKSIDLNVAKREFGLNYTLNNVILNFRYCKPGEIQIGNTCSECSQGTYSLLWNSTQCTSCINNAICLGKEQISVDKGYWRYTKNTTYVVECPNNSACLGGYNDTDSFPVFCDIGYGGVLCSECQIYNNEKYERLTDFQCSQCPNPVTNGIRVVGLIIAILLFIAVLITINIKKKKESQTSILMRIMTNYLQIMTATLSYSMKFPDALLSLFLPVEKLGTGSAAVLSFDCFAKSSKITLFAPSTPFMKAFLTAILPIILFLLIVIAFGILHTLFKKWFTDFRRNVVVSTITIIFLLHPTLTQTAFGMFQCIQVDKNKYMVRIDLNMVCYSWVHLTWCFILGVPMIIIWVFGCPILALIVLYKNKKNLHQTNIQRYFIVLYQGLKDNRYYWEFVNTFRKVMIVSINVFLSSYALFYKGVSAIILIMILLRIQLNLDPYKLNVNNECEYWSYTSSLITLFGGVLYVTDIQRVGFIDIFVFIVIIVINFYFLLLWTYLISFSLHKFSIARKFTNYLRLILMRKTEHLTDNFSNFTEKSVSIPKPVKKNKKRKTINKKKIIEEFKDESSRTPKKEYDRSAAKAKYLKRKSRKHKKYEREMQIVSSKREFLEIVDEESNTEKENSIFAKLCIDEMNHNKEITNNKIDDRYHLFEVKSSSQKSKELIDKLSKLNSNKLIKEFEGKDSNSDSFFDMIDESKQNRKIKDTFKWEDTDEI